MAAKTVTHKTDLSFVSEERTRRGRLLDRNCFDVPRESYGEGWITGMKAARELLDEMKGGSSRVWEFVEVIEAAAHARRERTDQSRYGAAIGFLSMIEEILRAGAKRLNYAEWIDGRIDWQRQCNNEIDKWEDEKKKAFVERMKQAKAAKAAEQRLAA